MRALRVASVTVRLALAAALMYACGTLGWLSSMTVNPHTLALAIGAGVYALVIVVQVEHETREATK